MHEINIEELPNYLVSKVSREPTVIYFGVGSEFLLKTTDKNVPTKSWEPHENQQFPLFLHDFKLDNMQVKIILVLIDMDMSQVPYIVNEPGKFYSDTWNKTPYNNLYISDYNIEVITIKECIGWEDTKTIFSSFKLFDIRNTLTDICEFVVETNTLLFYHEFTGNNTIRLEHEIIKRFDRFDSKKICIDITRGSDNSCFFDMSKPESYPIIVIEGGQLRHLSFDNIESEYKKYIVKKYFFETNQNNNLYDKKEYILFKQYINTNKITLKVLRDSVLSLFRISYNIDNSTLLKSSNNTWQIYIIEYLSNICPDIKSNFLNIKLCLKRLSNIDEESIVTISIDTEKVPEKEPGKEPGKEPTEESTEKSNEESKEIKSESKIIENPKEVKLKIDKIISECYEQIHYESFLIIKKVIHQISNAIDINDKLLEQLFYQISSETDKYLVTKLIEEYCFTNGIITEEKSSF